MSAPTDPSPTSPAPVRSGTPTAIRVGLVLFVVGLLFIAVDVLPFFAGDTNRPLWLNLACLAAPIGFAVVVWTGLRRGRREARTAAELAARPAADGGAGPADAASSPRMAR